MELLLTDSIGQGPSAELDSWYISDVYRARRKNREPFYVVQIYNGIQDGKGFGLGCLVVFDSKENHLRTIEGERVLVGLLGPDYDFETDYPLLRKKVENQEIIDLPDINGDGFAEIPTHSWSDFEKQQPESNSVYLTDNDSVSCAWKIEYYADTVNMDGTDNDRWPFEDLLFGCFFPRLSQYSTRTIMVMVQPFNIKYSNRGMTMHATHDLTKPPRTMARYKWNRKKRIFDGPAEGPNGLWKVISK